MTKRTNSGLEQDFSFQVTRHADAAFLFVDELDTKVAGAVSAVTDAQNDADRASAKAKLVALQREQYEMKQRAKDAKAAADLAERKKGVKISKECMENPLAKGCS